MSLLQRRHNLCPDIEPGVESCPTLGTVSLYYLGRKFLLQTNPEFEFKIHCNQAHEPHRLALFTCLSWTILISLFPILKFSRFPYYICFCFFPLDPNVKCHISSHVSASIASGSIISLLSTVTTGSQPCTIKSECFVVAAAELTTAVTSPCLWSSKEVLGNPMSPDKVEWFVSR